MSFNYSTGAKGFIVERLQQGLGILADGEFGKQTALAIQRIQLAHKLPPTGRAGQREFEATGVEWPTEFARAMNLVSNFEGTSFGDCNARDIDDAGLTMGIAGFTTAHGEVQQLLAEYLSEMPAALNELPARLRDRLTDCMDQRRSAVQWRKLFYGADNVVSAEWRTALRQWGRCPAMRKLQLHTAKKRFWTPATAAAASLGFTSLQARCFFLDVAVQNGGWRRQHLATVRRMSDWQSNIEQKSLIVAARAVAACANEEWRNDVLARKMTLATGRGLVHGREWSMAAHGLI